MGDLATLGAVKPPLEGGVIAVDVQSKRFGATEVLRDVRFSLGLGEAMAIIGRSGIGKSTLLRIIAGLDPTFSGSVQVPPRIGLVFQEPTLLPWRSVLANLTLMHPDSTQAQARDMLERVGLADKAELWPRQLSLGQQRRLALARAFLGRPEFLVMDEPYTSLDPEIHGEMLDLTQSLVDEYAPAVLLVTHDRAEAARLAGQTVELFGNPATLREVTL
jgi:NitT/TauT family transport system ATP-binding protein